MTSLEISKQLYEVSGWVEELDWDNDKSLLFNYHCYEWDDNLYRTGEKWIANNHMIYMASADSHKICPAYDSDYLLEKLPNMVDNAWLNLGPETSYKGLWVADYQGSGSRPIETARNPADALALLAIELFKQGILTRSES